MFQREVQGKRKRRGGKRLKRGSLDEPSGVVSLYVIEPIPSVLFYVSSQRGPETLGSSVPSPMLIEYGDGDQI